MASQRMTSHRARNLLQTSLLLASILGLVALLGWLFAGPLGIVWALLLGVIPLIVSIRILPTLTLRIYRTRPISRHEAPHLVEIVAVLAERAGLDQPPCLHYLPSSAALVFSTGHGPSAVIAVADGTLRLLDLRELIGVLAHEMSHIANNDTWVMSLADVASRAIRALSLLGQLLVLINIPLYILNERSLPWLPLLLMAGAPVMSALLQLALSRTREYDADLLAARICGDPTALASALAKLEHYQQQLLGRRFLGRIVREPSLLRTHPSTTERVRRLLAYDQELHPRWTALHKKEEPSFPCWNTSTSHGRPRRRISGVWY